MGIVLAVTVPMGSRIDTVHYRLIVYSKLAGDPGGG